MTTANNNSGSQPNRSLKQLEVLREISLAITAQLGKDALLKTILEHAVELMGAEGAGIYEYHAREEELILVADHFRNADIVGVRLKKGEGMAGRLVADDKPFMIVEDYAAWDGRAVVYQETVPFGAVIEVPLTWQSEIIGVLYVDDRPGRVYTEADTGLLRSFADQAAIALVTAELMRQNKQKLARLEQVTKAGNIIMRQLTQGSLEDTLELITEQAARILNAETCGIFLVKRPGFLSLEASYGHRTGGFQRGRELPIVSGIGTGLTGHIAWEGKLSNISGDELAHHPARKGEPPHAASGQCRSLLAIPLFGGITDTPRLLGLLRVDNKREDQPSGASGCFTVGDEWVLTLFADVVITALNNAELLGQLGQQKEKSRQLIADAPYCVIAIDLHGRITEFNDQAARMLGYSAEEVLNHSVAFLYEDPEEPRRVGEQLLASATGRISQYETTVVGKSGETIPIRLAAGWLTDDRGLRAGSVGFFEDLRPITEVRQRLELLLNAANLVAQADNLKAGLKRLAEMIVTLLDSSLCGIYLLFENDACLLLRAREVAGHAQDKIRWPQGENRIELQERPELERLLRAGRPLFLARGNKEHRPTLRNWVRLLGLKGKVRALTLIPLKAGGEAVGLLCLGEVRGKGRVKRAHSTIEPAAAIADQTAVFIERIHFLERTERRRNLLQALDDASQHIRGEQHPAKLLQEVVRLAVELVDFTAGGLYINQPQLGRLAQGQVYGLPEDVAGEYIYHDDKLLGHAARDGKTHVMREYALPGGQKTYHTGVALPLKQAGSVEAVLFLLDARGKRSLMAADREVLERYAVQASLALRTSRLLNQEQRMFTLLRILHRITGYIQAAGERHKVLHVALTATTAGYSLGLNRAALFLLDPTGEMLVGEMGIGQMEAGQAHFAWQQDTAQGLNDLQRYLEALEAGSLLPTPMDERIRRVQLPLADDLFSQVVWERKGVIGGQPQLARLPELFVDAFEPAAPFVVVPLVVQERAIGLIVADNKFTQSPVTSEDFEALHTIASSAAVALDNITQMDEIAATRDRLHDAFAASGELLSPRPPREVLDKIVEQARAAAGAIWASLILIDQLGHTEDLVNTDDRVRRNYDIKHIVRRDGISARVMREGKAYLIADTARESTDINPFLLIEKVRAALCLPFSHGERAIGVMWLHFDQPRHFPPAELDVLQLYVNQAALAFSSARQYKELKDMQRAARDLAAAGTLPEVLDQIVQSAMRVLHADSAAFWLYDAQRRDFLPQSSIAAGFPEQTWEAFHQREPRPGDTAYNVLDKGWLGVDDIDDVERFRFLSELSREHLRRIGVLSYQAVALSVGEEQLGVLFVNYMRRRLFTPAVRSTAQAFANHAALALKKAQLLEQVSRARNTARVVAELTTLDNLAFTLKSVVEGTKNVLNCDAVVLYVYDFERARFLYPPTMSGVDYPARVQSKKRVPPGSIAWRMLERDEPYIVERIRDEPDFRERRFALEEGIASCAAVPLRVGSRRVGVMFINYRTEHRFTSSEQINMRLFAHQAAVAIQGAQLYEQAQKRALALVTLNEAGRRITGSLEMQEIWQNVVEQAWRLTTSYGSQPAHYAGLMLLDGNQLRLVAAYPANHLIAIQEKIGVRDLDIPDQMGVTGRAIHTGRVQIVPDVSQDADYIRYEPRINSEIAIPLLMGDQRVGVLNLEHTELDAFVENTVEAVVSLASQAAIAIQNAHAYDEARILQRVAAALAGTLDWDRVLNLLLDAAMDLTATDSGSILLWEAEKQRFTSAYTSAERGRRPTEYETSARKGGLAWEIVHRQTPVRISDSTQDRRVSEVARAKGRRALIGVPLIGESGTIGVLYVNSSMPRQFTDHQLMLLRSLASQGAAAVEKVHQFQELKHARGMVGTATAAAWLGMASSIWLHAVKTRSLTISGDLGLLRNALTQEGLAASVEARLDKIEREVQQLVEHPITPALSEEEGVESIPLNAFLLERVSQLKSMEDYRAIDFHFELQLSDPATVRAGPVWLREVIDILINNAREAMTERKQRRLTVSTGREEGGVQIAFHDTGCGIPAEVQQLLFKRPIAGSRGWGMGLLLAQIIMQVYGGRAQLLASDSTGTSIALWLPLE